MKIVINGNNNKGKIPMKICFIIYLPYNKTSNIIYM